jgi:hypothetical protein
MTTGAEGLIFTIVIILVLIAIGIDIYNKDLKDKREKK